MLQKTYCSNFLKYNTSELLIVLLDLCVECYFLPLLVHLTCDYTVFIQLKMRIGVCY